MWFVLYFYWAALLKSQVTKEVRQREKYLGKPGIQPKLICTVFYGIKISLALIPWPVWVIQDLRFTIFCIFSGLLPSYDKVNKTLLVYDNMTGFPLRKRQSVVMLYNREKYKGFYVLTS